MIDLPENTKDVIVFYHDSCMDGFAAAALMFTKYSDAFYHAVNYGRRNEVPVEGKTVFFVDFCPDTEWVTANWEKTERCIVLDHHKDAYDKVLHIRERLRETDVVGFDMDHSGAGLVWHYLHGETSQMPAMVKLIELRDLWKLTPEMRKYHEYFVTFLGKGEPGVIFPPLVKVLLTNDQSEVDEIGKIADILVRARDQHVNWFMESATWWYRGKEIEGPQGTVTCTVAMLNCPHIFISEVASQILEKNPKVDLVIGTSISGRGMGLSFRSRAGSGIASKSAKLFNGGGHADAAGGRIQGLMSYDEILSKVCKS